MAHRAVAWIVSRLGQPWKWPERPIHAGRRDPRVTFLKPIGPVAPWQEGPPYARPARSHDDRSVRLRPPAHAARQGRNVGALHEVSRSTSSSTCSTSYAPEPSLDPQRVDDVILRVVTPIGDQGADIAKTAALAAGYPVTPAGVLSTGSAPPVSRRSTRLPRGCGPASRT